MHAAPHRADPCAPQCAQCAHISAAQQRRPPPVNGSLSSTARALVVNTAQEPCRLVREGRAISVQGTCRSSARARKGLAMAQA